MEDIETPITQDRFNETTHCMILHNKRIERASIFLLIVLGIVAGLSNGLVLFCSSVLCQFQAWLLTNNYGFIYYMLTTVSFCIFATYLCKSFATSAVGSGLPEFKHLLSHSCSFDSKDYERLIGRKVLLTKIIGLIFSSGSGLSIGGEGPLVHTAACIAYFLMKYTIYEFEIIFDSASVVKQIFAASAAIGISSAFNAPVGGLLFSVEATATYYLISNYWKSCIAAASGAVACYFFLSSADEDPLVVLHMDLYSNEHIFSKFELLIFFLMGVVLGYLSLLYLYLNQRVLLFLRPYNAQYPYHLTALVASFSAVLIFLTHSFTATSVCIISAVSDVLNSGSISELRGSLASAPSPAWPHPSQSGPSSHSSPPISSSLQEPSCRYS